MDAPYSFEIYQNGGLILLVSDCDGSCEESDDEDIGSHNVQEDDLDGKAGFFDGDGHEFGPEPNTNPLFRYWGCDHAWTRVSRTGYASDVKSECMYCWKVWFCFVFRMCPGNFILEILSHAA